MAHRLGPALVLLLQWMVGGGDSCLFGQPPRATERPLGLDAAIAEALEENPGLRIAALEQAAAAAGARSAGAFLWPRLGFDGGLATGVDPVFTFGTKLRQARFGEPDFALEALNDPDRLEDWTAALDVRWEALSPGLWAARSAAEHMSEAARWTTLRAQEATALGVRERYWNAVRTAAQRESAGAAEDAARATLERFKRRETRGLLTEADRLQAEAELASARALRVDAERRELEARQKLGAFLAWDPSLVPVPTDTLEEPTELEVTRFEPRARGDLRALAREVEARAADRDRATLAYAPSIDAFGRFGSHARAVFDSDATDWTAGFVLRWTVLDGFRRPAETSRARAAEQSARIGYEQALREAKRELDSAWRAVGSAREAYEAARLSRVAAGAAVALLRRRFEEGLTTPAELLQAEARAALSRSRAVDALADWHIAKARVQFVGAQSDSPEER